MGKAQARYIQQIIKDVSKVIHSLKLNIEPEDVSSVLRNGIDFLTVLIHCIHHIRGRKQRDYEHIYRVFCEELPRTCTVCSPIHPDKHSE
jgi:hypothetical protein